MTAIVPPPVFQILMVEDNDADVYLFRKCLEESDVQFELRILGDGSKALSYVSKTEDESVAPHLIVLDLNLPKNGGVEILSAIRGNSRFFGIPLVVTSSSSSLRDRERVEALGITRYIRKPPDLEDFLKLGRIFKEILESRHVS